MVPLVGMLFSVTPINNLDDVNTYFYALNGPLSDNGFVDGRTFNVVIDGMNQKGTVILQIDPILVSDVTQRPKDAAGNVILPSEGEPIIYFDPFNNPTPPSAVVDKATSQADPTNTAPINFNIVFSEPVAGFTSAGVSISGTAPGTKNCL